VQNNQAHTTQSTTQDVDEAEGYHTRRSAAFAILRGCFPADKRASFLTVMR
jgi:hypothetical protein